MYMLSHAFYYPDCDMFDGHDLCNMYICMTNSPQKEPKRKRNRKGVLTFASCTLLDDLFQ